MSKRFYCYVYCSYWRNMTGELSGLPCFANDTFGLLMSNIPDISPSQFRSPVSNCAGSHPQRHAYAVFVGSR